MASVHQSLPQEPVVARSATGIISSQAIPAQAPALGVYQHQNVHINDFSRLLESMQLSTAPQGNVQQEHSQVSSQQFQKQYGTPMETIHQVQQSNHSPYTPTFDHTHSHNLSPAISSTPQAFYSSNNTSGFIGIPSTTSPPSDSTYNLASLQQYLPAQGLAQMQQTQFQAPSVSSQQTLQVLQAAVAIQDGAFADLGAGGPINTFGARQFVQSYSEIPWSVTAGDVPAGGSPMHQLHQVQSNAIFDNGMRPGGPSVQSVSGSNFHRSGPKFSLPPLSTSAASSLHPSINGMNQNVSNGVPLLLPALAPSSPQASSEESSPVTPTFPQGQHGLISGHEGSS